MILTREQAIDKLIEHDMELIRRQIEGSFEKQSEELYKLLKEGAQGYNNFNNHRLKAFIKMKCNKEIEII